ncbi:hypothetical protein OHA40_00935 [Nocardia sp. NBC_00508]|uniref:hypothetical protein n=1 Tax=Nocardia sp. NBC_00508 TaxID=2975992 RepID=UPI002E80D674|nr:hypothetical protein [Nocardia sp. NBC_00508]WUD66770.1 hypothetical protein OHA40_00935 [Nocardia sp. NBC_00508]
MSDNTGHTRDWTDEELAYIGEVQQRLSGPLSEHQLAVLRRWWQGGYAKDQ